MSEGWELVESSFRVEQNKAWEGLFTLGSGYLHVRGSLEEHLSDAPQNRVYTRLPANVSAEVFGDRKSKWGTYVPGVFGPHPLLNAEMINLPWCLGIAPTVDGERLDMEHCRIENYRRTLHLDSALLNRSFVWITRSGKRIRMEFERFVHAVHRHVCIQRLRISSEVEGKLDLEAGIDADVRTNGHDHFSTVQLARRGPNRIECRLHTDGGDDVEVYTQLIRPGTDWSYHPAGDRAAALRAELWLRTDGGPIVLEKRTAIATSRDRTPTTAGQCLREIEEENYATLRASHEEAWRRRWESCDVAVEGDPASQLALRASIYHLLRAHVPDDPRVAIDAKGYAGEAYWGRYFWDTEIFLLPFYLYTDPPRARTLVDFRVETLDGARANAARYGYHGARYAWESDAAGLECCPSWQYADHEVHVTSDVAFGLVHYARGTADASYLRGPAATVLVEIARYWMERIDIRPEDGRPSILAVMGPDEYAPISLNNSFTNMLAAEALRAAADCGPAGGATAEECEAFRRIADGLTMPRSADGGLILQSEEFEMLAEPRFEEFWKDRRRPFAAQITQERLYRIKALKQPDVLMLMMLLPQRFTEAEIRRAWDYYLPYTTHDSSLSAGVHAIVAARLGLADEAWHFWEHSLDIDLDTAHGKAAEGIHIANAGAVWQVAVLGFAGFQTAMETDVLSFSPRLPKRWSRLSFPLVWKGTGLHVDLTADTCVILNRGPGPLRARVNGCEKIIEPGTTAEWAVNPAASSADPAPRAGR